LFLAGEGLELIVVGDLLRPFAPRVLTVTIEQLGVGGFLNPIAFLHSELFDEHALRHVGPGHRHGDGTDLRSIQFTLGIGQ
jgi:hypothetical protein